MPEVWKEVIGCAVAVSIICGICWMLWGLVLPAFVWSLGIWAIVMLARYGVAEWLDRL